MLKAVIFDMDGVLADSQPLHFEADRRTLENHGLKVPEEEMVPYAGTSNTFRFGLFRDKYKIGAPLEELVNEREQHMEEIIGESSLTAVPGTEKLIKGIKSRGYPLALASSSSEKVIEAELKKIGLYDHFDLIFSGDGMKRGKPFPDIFIETARRLETAPADCLVVEDSHNGVVAAKAAGMKCIGYINETSGEQDLTAADMIIDDFRGIMAAMLPRIWEE